MEIALIHTRFASMCQYTRGTVIEDGGLDTTLERSFLDTNCYIRHQEAPKATPDIAFAMVTQIIHGSRPSKQAGCQAYGSGRAQKTLETHG